MALAIIPKWPWWWWAFFLVLKLPLLFLALIYLLCVLSLNGHVDPNLGFKVIDWVIRPLYWFTLALIALVGLVAARGWVDFVRWHHRRKDTFAQRER
jgi:hypothetical protein